MVLTLCSVDLVSDPAPGSEEEEEAAKSASDIVDHLEQAYRDSGGSSESCSRADVEVTGGEPPANGFLFITLVLIARTWIVFFSSTYTYSPLPYHGVWPSNTTRLQQRGSLGSY